MAEKKEFLRETDAEAIRLAKTLLRTARYGALATIEPETGAPLATRVAVATDVDGAPLILVSALSAHTPALLAEPRCSLLLGEPGRGDPLAHPRVTLACASGRLERHDPAHARAERRYLNRHPGARLYAGFGDFSYFRLEPAGANLNGGFGKAYRLRREDLLTVSPALDALANAEQSAIDHMNTDHRDALAACARHFAGQRGDGWLMTGIDADGFDMANGDHVCRVFFPSVLNEASKLREILVKMARKAKASA